MSGTPAQEPLWTVAEVARLLSMSPQWVYKHAELGNLPCLRLGGALRFQPSEVRRYIEQRAHRRPARTVLDFPSAD